MGARHSLLAGKRSFLLVLTAALVCGLVLWGCHRDTPPLPAVDEDEARLPAGPLFEDRTEGSGVRHTYRNGEEAGHMAILESLGGGAGLLDYDSDGLLDLFLPGGGHYDRTEEELKKKPGRLPEIKGHPAKLYRNKGGWKFEDVTAKVGLDKPLFYTHGAAVADYNRDGWTDLLVTGWGRMALYRNDPVDPRDPKKGRKFTEVSKEAELPEGLWTTSAAWGDVDGDGYPDLYVCQYADWSFQHKHPTDCTYDGKTRDVCPPKKFLGLPHKLFLNLGNGKFKDVSKEAGLRTPRTPKEYEQLSWLPATVLERLRAAESDDTGYGKGLGVLMVDVNGDGKLDIYVANDTVDNFLYINRTEKPGQPRFEEKGMESGTARDEQGLPNGSMGLDAADVTGSGLPSLWVTNYENELPALYRNGCKGGREFFTHATQTAGLGATMRRYVGWGTTFLDTDHHGYEDLFFSAGHAIRFPTGEARRAEAAVLIRNLGPSATIRMDHFKDMASRGGPYFQRPHVGRGAALGDLDNDGRFDLVLAHLNEPAAVLANTADTAGRHWLGIALEGKGRRDVVGARLILEAGGRKQARFAKGGGSYASASDPRHIFGLDSADRIDRLTVYWPWGQEQTWTDLPVDRHWRLVEGEAKAQAPRAGR